MGDLAADYERLRTSGGARWSPRDVVRVWGSDARRFLQGQCSQDIEALADGESSWSFVLQPQGKVDALVRVTRLGADEVVLDIDGGFGAALIERLLRFKLRVKADIESLGWRCLSVRGPAAEHALAAAAGDAIVVDASWPGLAGRDLLGPDPRLGADLPFVGDEAWSAVRIESGAPAMGAELTDRTIPGETGILERAVSFTKGCYTGQELVARIDSRGGNVPRHLRGVVLAELVCVGCVLRSGGREVGALTSVAARPGGAVGLAYVSRDVVVPATVEVGEGADRRPARVELLPLVP